MTEKELIDKSRLEGKADILKWLLELASKGIENKTPSSEIWQALFSEQLYTLDSKLGRK